MTFSHFLADFLSADEPECSKDKANADLSVTIFTFQLFQFIFSALSSHLFFYRSFISLTLFTAFICFMQHFRLTSGFILPT
jgi:hypothetical protein